MKLHEKIALVMVIGMAVAYLAGWATIRISHDVTAGMLVSFVLSFAALAGGWSWAKAGGQ